MFGLHSLSRCNSQTIAFESNTSFFDRRDIDSFMVVVFLIVNVSFPGVIFLFSGRSVFFDDPRLWGDVFLGRNLPNLFGGIT